ncbi:MAG: hypothetical protein R3F65_20280 [bacterium]
MDAARFATLCRPDGEGLPHPDPAPIRLQILITALSRAWAGVQRQMLASGDSLSALDEDQTTTLLIAWLEHLLDHEAIPGFSAEFYGVTRDAKVVNHDGHHPDKMPDVTFSLRPGLPGLPGTYSLHAECKPVGRQHGHAPYRGRDGMGCFIHGDYGCKTTLGLMIAYADPGYTFADKVLPALSQGFGQPDDPHATTILPLPDIDPPSSSHRRIWHYANGNAPGDIRLLHIWLTR